MGSKQLRQKLRANLGERTFEIARDGTVGWYLYVYVGDRCTHDYLQDTLEQAKSHAAEHFGVPADTWRAID